MHIFLLVSAVILSSLIQTATHAVFADEASERFFENQIRPLLAEHCIECHGPEKQSGGLRLDSQQNLLKGGDSGEAVVPGKPGNSRLIMAVQYNDDLKMPPDQQLTEDQVRLLVHWVESGAEWPAAVRTIEGKEGKGSKGHPPHWAFEAVQDPPVPPAPDSDKVRTPVDAFILQKLRAAGLSPSPMADRRTMIRRLSWSLTGLPPTSEEVTKFLNDTSPDFVENSVERLLSSPAYGEHWARRWLDVARYSDTKGYVYAREERFWIHAWAYRDWVVNALNSDMPYDRFLLLQIAADQVADRQDEDLAAMGFLTIGRRFLGVQRDIIDDRIDVVTRGTMSLTVGCARCHDHKYDPIPTADYYSLYGVFASCSEQVVALPGSQPADEAFRTELNSRQAKLASTMQERREATASRIRARVGDYLRAQKELSKYPEEGFDQILATTDILPAFVRRWQAWLRETKRQSDPIFIAWHSFFDLPADDFAARAREVHAALLAPDAPAMHPDVSQAFSAPPQSFDDVIERYASLLARVDSEWQQAMTQAKQSGSTLPAQLANEHSEQLRRVLYGPGSPCEVPDEPIVNTENDFDSAACTELWKLQAEVDRWIISGSAQARFAVILKDRDVPHQPRIFRRGNPATKGDEVPRQFLSLLADKQRRPFQQGSGRLELAQAIISPNNPLTARVMVNRVWAQHFGTGLVATPGDFGTRAEAPSHPELLDWLASRFMAEGWSLKKLHRLIVLSSTFLQSSSGPDDSDSLDLAQQTDPSNRLLWRMNGRRLSFEEMRDSMLAVSGQLDRSTGGKPANLFAEPFPVRRTLYGLVDRQFLPGTLRMFDFANPDLHIPQRSETTVAQQALFLMNHPVALERARELAKTTAGVDDPEARVQELFQAVFQRPADASEIQDALEMIQQAEPASEVKPSRTAENWSYGYGHWDGDTQRVSGFTALPHFTGTAWQGGPKWPDPTLGWVQLTATGGHPGNDRQHASVRRWTSPQPMRISIQTELVHEPAAGDGVRAWIVSSRSGLLQSAAVHQKSVALNVEPFDVEAGETIDFVVDIGEVLNSDQYLWRSTIQPVSRSSSEPPSLSDRWNSEADFTADTLRQLTAWEQLAQVLMCSNEFLFVD